MSEPKTSEKSVYLDREEHFHRGNVGAKTVVPYFYDSVTDTLNPGTNDDPAYAVQLDDSADPVIYIGKASPGTATSSAAWQIAKLDSTSGLVKTWADGDSSFNNIFDNRASLTYQ